MRIQEIDNYIFEDEIDYEIFLLIEEIKSLEIRKIFFEKKDEDEIAIVLGHAASDAVVDVFCCGRGRGFVFAADIEIVR